MSVPVYAGNTMDGDWIHVAHSEFTRPQYTDDFFYDKRTATRTGNIVAYWEKTISVYAKTANTEAQRFVGYAHFMVDCEKQQSAVDAVAIEGSEGVGNVPAKWQTFGPNTPGMAAMLFVCKNVH
jgi:hypothetical protein